MSLADDFYIVFRNSSNRKLRSWLTVLGVVIGVAAIIALVSVSRGLELSIEQQFEEFGVDKITILEATTGGIGATPGLGSGLTDDDIDAIENVKGLEYVAGMLSKSAKIEHKKDILKTFLTGLPTHLDVDMFQEFNLEFTEGSAFTTNSNKIVIGPRVANDLFEKDISIRSKIEIEDVKFEVVGILESVGNPQDDSAIYMPLGKMRDLFDEKDSVNFIVAKVKPGTDLNEAADKITQALKKVRSEESFNVITPEQLLEQLGAVLGIIQGVLVGIATISLVVGSVGIANSMYTSVLERTRDVGIMKAVGASNNEIITIFLIEAGLVGLIGGIIGVTIGILIAQLIGFAAAQAGFSVLKIFIEPWLIAFGLAFAVLVGMISGFFPARQAARLNPVDALRK